MGELEIEHDAAEADATAAAAATPAPDAGIGGAGGLATTGGLGTWCTGEVAAAPATTAARTAAGGTLSSACGAEALEMSIEGIVSSLASLLTRLSNQSKLVARPVSALLDVFEVMSTFAALGWASVPPAASAG